MSINWKTILLLLSTFFFLGAQAQNISYQWSTGDTTAGISPNPTATTTYYVTVTQYGVSYTDSFVVVVNPIETTPVSVAICAGDSFTSAGGQQLSIGGVYFDTLLASTGCDSIIQTTLTVNPLPVFSMPEDTVLSCGVDSVQLDAGAGFASYQWSTGDTVQSPFIAASGMYYVTVTNGAGCEASDSVYVSLINAEIAQEDTAICIGESLALGINIRKGKYTVGSEGPAGGIIVYDHNAQHTDWQYIELASNDLPTNVGVTGCYCITVPNLSNSIGFGASNQLNWDSLSCSAGAITLASNYSQGSFDDWFLPSRDELDSIYQYSLIDTSLSSMANKIYWTNSEASFGSCGINGGVWVQDFTDGSSFSRYRASFANGGYARAIRYVKGYEYQWSTGDTTATINVSPTQTTTYYVTITDGVGSCTDSVTVTVNSLPVVSMPEDTVLSCGVDSVQLDAGAGFASYQWSTGDTVQSPFVAASGMYYVTVTNGAGCEASDSVYVSLINAAIAQEDTAICIGESLTFSIFDAVNEQLVTTSMLVVPVAYSSIQAAIDDASNGDTIYVQNGVYYENIDFTGKSLTLLGEDKYQTILDGINGSSSVVNLDGSSILSGFTIRNGKGKLSFSSSGSTRRWGGGVYAISGSNIVENCIFKENNLDLGVDSRGGGVYTNGSTTVRNCYFSDNSVGQYGAAIVGGAVENCLFENHTNGASAVHETVLLSNSVIKNNSIGGLFYLGGPNGLISNSKIFSNSHGLHLVAHPTGSNIINSSIYGNINQFGDTNNIVFGTNGPAAYSTIFIDSSYVEGDSTLNPNTQWGEINWGENLYQAPIMINAGLSSNLHYTWSTGDTTATINVSPTQTTTYYVTITDGIGSCMDSVTVTVNSLPVVSMPEDSVLSCGVDSVQLDAGTGFASYQWSTGDTVQSPFVAASGMYYVTVTNGAGCEASDSVYVSLINAEIVQEDTIICVGSSLLLSAFNQAGVANGILPSNLQKQLKAWYPFNGNAQDESGEGFNAHSIDAQLRTDRFGNTDRAYYFNGTSNYINLGLHDYLNGANAFTISLHIKPENNPNNRQFILARGYDYANGSFFICHEGNSTQWPNSLRSSFNGYNTHNSITDSSYSKPYQNWQSVIITKDSTSNQVETYLDGELVSVTNIGQVNMLNALADSLYVGTHRFINQSPGWFPYFYQGSIDDIGIWKRSLSTEEVSQISGTDNHYLWSTGDTTANINVSPTQTTTYYVTITNGAGSCMDSVTVTVNDPILTASVSPTDCATSTNGSASVSMSNGSAPYSYAWSTGDTTATITGLGVGTYSVTVSDSIGCSLDTSLTIIAVDTIAPVAQALPITLYLDAAGAATVNTTMVDNGTTDNCGIFQMTLSDTLFTCADTGIQQVMFSVYDTAMNADTIAVQVTVLDTITPTVLTQNLIVYLDATGNANITAMQVDNGSTDNCVIDTMYLDVTNFDCADTGLNIVMLSALDVSGNMATASANITVLDTIVPSAVAQNLTVYLDATGNATINAAQVDNGSADNCGIDTMYLDQYNFNCGDTGQHTITLTVVDHSGNTSTALSIVSVSDTVSPTPVVNTLTLFLDAFGLANLSAAQVDNGSYDNCNIDTMYLDQYVFTCADTGINNVTFTVADVNGNSSMAVVPVNILDTLAPAVHTQNLIVYLDATGNATITAAQIDNGTSDNCVIDTIYLDVTSFDCTETGQNVVTLTAVDVSGNMATASANITVLDTTAPSAVAQNLIVYLDATGNASITAAQINNGSADNCGIDTMYLDRYGFNCADTGQHTITLTVVDHSGNTSTALSIVSVADTVSPTPVVNTLTLFLDAFGLANLTAAQVDNGTYDNCSIDTMYLDQYVFSCADTGMNNVTFTVVDVNGNSSMAVVPVTILDTTAPSVVAQNLTVYLGASGGAAISAAQVDNGSTDNCGIDTMYLSQYNFNCADTGSNTVTLTGIDHNGNANTAFSTIVVVDTASPTLVVNTLTLVLDEFGLASLTTAQVDNGSYDNCAIDTMYLDQYAFSCADTGLNTITLTAMDVNGNSASIAANISVLDTTAPAVITQNVTVYLNAMGSASIAANQIDMGSTDNCGIDTMFVSQSLFGCADTGINTITLNVVDQSGNMAVESASVTVLDTLAPVVLAQNITVYLDANGMAAITPSQVDNGSSDNCSIDTMYLDQSSFNCGDTGQVQINLFVVDGSGNTSTAPVLVTIEDTTSPVILIQSQSVFLNSAGLVDLTTAQLNNGTYDNCGLDTMYLDQYSFNCADTGWQSVTFTAVDVSGNVSSQQVNVYVQDTVSPLLLALDTLQVYLGSNGKVVLDTSMFDLGSSDNCGILSYSIVPKTFYCSNMNATYQVLYRLNDYSGNFTTKFITVTIHDSLPPVITASDTTVYLDANGMASLDTAYYWNETADNCQLQSVSLSPQSFDCSALGSPQMVTITAIDASGNVAIDSFNVTVKDAIAPTLQVASNLTYYLNASGTITLTGNMLDGGSSDNCGIASKTVSPATWYCSDEGYQLATFKVTDQSGNTTDTLVEVQILDTHNAITGFNGPLMVGDQSIHTYSVDSINGASYNWNLVSGILLNAPDAAVDIKWTIAANAQLQIIQTTAYGCSDTLLLPIDFWPLGIDEINAADGFVLYPNPTRSRASIASTHVNDLDCRLTLVAYDGSIVWTKPYVPMGQHQQAYEFSVEELASGFYSVVIEYDNQVVRLPVVVSR